jgi:hypothetical protein
MKLQRPSEVDIRSLTPNEAMEAAEVRLLERLIIMVIHSLLVLILSLWF